jgi:hypothetical protein
MALNANVAAVEVRFTDNINFEREGQGSLGRPVPERDRYDPGGAWQRSRYRPRKSIDRGNMTSGDSR